MLSAVMEVGREDSLLLYGLSLPHRPRAVQERRAARHQKLPVEHQPLALVKMQWQHGVVESGADPAPNPEVGIARE
jgi:hypothetical protein